MIRALVLVIVTTTACDSAKPAPQPQPPSQALVDAMRDYCKISQMPTDKQREGFKMWGWHIGGDKELSALWTRAVKGKDAAAIATVRAAAERAAGSACNLGALGQ